uniref:Si:ch211-153f2.7 n=1 Tax=Oryzias latipes TaxID=8090 RepID=A0A3P9M2L8_ORYLA
MEVLLTRLRDFSCRTSTFEARRRVFREPESPTRPCRDAGGGNLDIESALVWLRRELMELRSQDQALVRQLMELHSGIQELKQELEQEEETDEDEEEGCYWDHEERGGSMFSNSGETFCLSVHQKQPHPPFTGGFLEKVSYRRSSVP